MATEEIGPAARFIGPARLDGFRLAFRRRSVRWGGGAADILPAPGEVVWGALYELPPDALVAIDAKEGAGFAYRRRSVTVEHDGRRVGAIAYEVINKEPADVPPTPEYLALVRAAARERGLPASYIAILDAFSMHFMEKSSQMG